MRRASWS
jgi:hypothetical protein